MEMTLADGTVFQNSYAMISSRLLMVYIQDGVSDLRTVFDALIDPEKTAVVSSVDYAGKETVFRGYTKLIAVRDEGDGLFTAVLDRPDEETRLASDGE